MLNSIPIAEERSTQAKELTHNLHFSYYWMPLFGIVVAQFPHIHITCTHSFAHIHDCHPWVGLDDSEFLLILFRFVYGLPHTFSLSHFSRYFLCIWLFFCEATKAFSGHSQLFTTSCRSSSSSTSLGFTVIQHLRFTAMNELGDIYTHSFSRIRIHT